MKKTLVISILVSLIMFCAQTAFSQSIDELTEQFEKEIESNKPPSETSSVGTDYIYKQTALATMYTTKMLKLMYEQNQEILSKYDEILQKYDEMIQQNNEIIKLLSELVKKDE